MSGNGSSRDSGLELLRIVCMVLIVAYHMVGGTQDWIEYPDRWAWNLVSYHAMGLWGQAAVLCFVMITGYFMVLKRVRASKIIRLAAEVWFYSVAISAVMVWAGIAEWDWSTCLVTALPILSREYWFVTDYIILLLLSPVLNRMLTALSRRQFGYGLAIMLAVAYVCSGLMRFEFLGSIPFMVLFYSLAAYIRLHPAPVMGNRILWPVLLVLCMAYGFLLMLVMNGIYQGTGEPLLVQSEDPAIAWYVVGSLAILAAIAISPVPRKSAVLAVAAAIVLLLSYWVVMPYRGLGTRGLIEERWSILMGLAAVSMFLTFRNMHMPTIRAVNWMAGGVLGVYLVHEHWAVKDWVWSRLFEPDMLMQSDFVIAAPTAIVLLVLVCILIDRARDLILFRQVAKLGPVSRVSARADAAFDRILSDEDG